MLISDFGLGPQLAGWELNAATAVSDDGLTIVGYGFAPSGEQAGWMVRLPHPCPADISGDADVNIDDLLAVINTWNALGGLADVNHDSIVNSDDLLIVINGWGPCP